VALFRRYKDAKQRRFPIGEFLRSQKRRLKKVSKFQLTASKPNFRELAGILRPQASPGLAGTFRGSAFGLSGAILPEVSLLLSGGVLFC